MTHNELLQIVRYIPETGEFISLPGNKYSNQPVGNRLGTVHKTKGYRYITIKHKTYREHRVAFFYMTGKWPDDQIDHINQNKADNRWINLREVSAATNCQNRPMFKNNKSGYTGVVWNKQCQKWQVNCRANSKIFYLGLYTNLSEAAKVATDFYSSLKD